MSCTRERHVYGQGVGEGLSNIKQNFSNVKMPNNYRCRAVELTRLEECRNENASRSRRRWPIGPTIGVRMPFRLTGGMICSYERTSHGEPYTTDKTTTSGKMSSSNGVRRIHYCYCCYTYALKLKICGLDSETGTVRTIKKRRARNATIDNGKPLNRKCALAYWGRLILQIFWNFTQYMKNNQTRTRTTVKLTQTQRSYGTNRRHRENTNKLRTVCALIRWSHCWWCPTTTV